MLKRRPEIHGNGAQLHLHLHRALLALEENGHLDDEMQTAIPARLGRGHVVAALDEPHVILGKQRFGQGEHVLGERAHHAHARHVVDVLLDGVHRHGEALAGELLRQAVGALQARFDGLNGIAVVLQAELGI